jgi:TorA maturation chaperone TorD
VLMHRPVGHQTTRAAGDVGALAQKIGASQPSLSNGSRITTERVTDSNRAVLRADLYGAIDPDHEIDAARAREYELLSVLLRRAPNADLMTQLAALRCDPSPLGIAHAALGEAAATANVERVEREFFDLFIGIGRGELLPYGSYYLTGFLNERPLARLRDDLARLGIERVDGEVEPEDHVALLCEIMAGLTGGRFRSPAGADRELFEKHLSPWIGRFFADLEQAQAADFYRRVGTIGRLFVEIESEAFALAS